MTARRPPQDIEIAFEVEEIDVSWTPTRTGKGGLIVIDMPDGRVWCASIRTAADKSPILDGPMLMVSDKTTATKPKKAELRMVAELKEEPTV